jgi:hypothetical protein
VGVYFFPTSKAPTIAATTTFVGGSAGGGGSGGGSTGAVANGTGGDSGKHLNSYGCVNASGC